MGKDRGDVVVGVLVITTLIFVCAVAIIVTTSIVDPSSHCEGTTRVYDWWWGSVTYPNAPECMK